MNKRPLTPEEQERLEHFKRNIQIQKRIGDRMARIRSKVLVASGKGGVGKTTAAVNLALAFAADGDQVGLLDADIHGPGVPRMLGMRDVRITGHDGALDPAPFNDRLVVMSTAFLLERDADAVIWRGPLKMAMIDNFLADVNWGELEWLVVDTPPGTGDEILSLAQRIKNVDGLIMVTTPQASAVAAARKSLSFAERMRIPILGVVEDMGPFPCPHCGGEIKLFGTGGGAEVAAAFGVPFLGTVPFDPAAVEAADGGLPILLSSPQGAAAQAWRRVADAVREAVAARKAAPPTAA